MLPSENALLLDNVAYNVPEPGTLVLLLGGFFAVIAFRRSNPLNRTH